MNAQFEIPGAAANPERSGGLVSDSVARRGATTLKAFAFFHLNLAFSSIEEERRGDVIASCYHPLLDLCERRGPLGVELSGYTLEEIAARDPSWITRARAL